MDRTQTIQCVKDWIALDAEIAALKKQTKLLNLKKKELTKSLVLTMRDHEIDEFEITDGKLVRQQVKTKKPLSKGYLLGCISKYFKGDDENVQQLSNLIFKTREEQITDRIVCKKK